MRIPNLQSFVAGRWLDGEGDPTPHLSAVTGEPVATHRALAGGFESAADHARRVGGPALRALTFHQRGQILKALAEAVVARKEELYELCRDTGATRRDGWIDIEGGAGVLSSYASKAKRELPDGHVLPDGDSERLGKQGQFIGQHIYSSRTGLALHINAFNFPVWGMLEKLAPALLAGLPVIIKPASISTQLAEATFRILMAAGVLPAGAAQLLLGPLGDLTGHLTGQDCIAFTGSRETALRLRQNAGLLEEGVRFNAEQDSLNAAILGPDAAPGTPEHELFLAEVVRELIVKSGQKCTAIRRILVPGSMIDDVERNLASALESVVVGDPGDNRVRMGALASLRQRSDVRSQIARLQAEARIVCGDPDHVPVVGGEANRGAFLAPILLRCDNALNAQLVHEIEAFGPVATLMPYGDEAEAIGLINRASGSLVASLFTRRSDVVQTHLLGIAPFHGRILAIDRDSAPESTGHGSPMPTLVHGGPGRAGGGEELGGIRAVTGLMQRTAIQASPQVLSTLLGSWLPGARTLSRPVHPFRKRFGELEIGETLQTEEREVSSDDIEHFARFTGDTFYAHMDEEAARKNPFFPGRVAHGYLLLSFAAGLFVDPAPGPVLANYGIEHLRFQKPISPGERISVQLVVKSKASRAKEHGEVRWAVVIYNQDRATVATYDLLTLNAI